MRGSNHIAALDELRAVFQSQEFTEATNFLDTRLGELLKNPAFRYQWSHRAARTDEFRDPIERARLIGNYFEDLGALVLAGLLDVQLTCMIYSSDVVNAWEQMAPLTAIGRRVAGGAAWENFEYLAMLSNRWIEAHPDGGYPRGAPRMRLDDEWLEADRQYAASLVPA